MINIATDKYWKWSIKNNKEYQMNVTIVHLFNDNSFEIMGRLKKTHMKLAFSGLISPLVDSQFVAVLSTGLLIPVFV